MVTIRRTCHVLGVWSVAVLASTGALAQQGAPANGEWPTYGGDLGSTKYSPLDQIDATNFGNLELAWRWRSADAFMSKTTPTGGEWRASSDAIFEALNQEDPDRWRDGQAPYTNNLKATPLMVGGRLFINMPTSQGAAIDAATGETLWVYNPKTYEAGTTTMTARWNQRGVAYWGGGESGRVYWGTSNGYLVCVEADTGRPCLDFGEQGRLDLMRDLPRSDRGDRDWLNALLYSVQSPPLVVGDTIITPSSISSYNISREAPPGWMRGFDTRSGRTKWTFRTIPQGDEFGNDTWGGDSWRVTGKVGVWSMMSADPELGLLYLPTNTPAPDYYGGHRPGANLFAESVVALNIETGEREWHFQAVHHGLWDYDFPAAPNLVDIEVDGRPIKALAQVSKQGFLYVFDRVTGEPVWPIEERAVPTDTDIAGEQAWPTQPFPTRPAPFEYQGATIDDLVDFTPQIRQMAVEAVDGFRLGPLFTPQSLTGTIQRPSTSGGANWSGAGVDPETGLLYVPSVNAFSVRNYREPEPGEGATLNIIELRGRGTRQPTMPQGLPLFKPPYSRMTAIDLDTGDHAWMQPLGNGERVRNHPMLRDLDLAPLGGDGSRSGPLVTKTLLIYALTTGGSDGGPQLIAVDKASGEELGSVDLPRGAIGTPMTYLLDGRQYIALTVGGSPVPELVAFALPE
ncbi:MAG: pyrroloquinoline quinone-dependent dehydrogenase [Vicinamibacterales bacterium]|jgi:quinoprotein glucose dehydrogenase|nr:pyrroloquinoline quinone-dependent dehydrogenase [Vicinamibacterales bacterium]HJN43969.1 pyrroloquinoline quinone-dependent dehydrogenase [Vicinamibacterales bacterium]